MVLKAFLFFFQQPKLEGGKWERKHFKLIFLQMLSVRCERLPGTGKGWEGVAELHVHASGGLGTIVAVTILPDFLPPLSYRQHSKGKEK